MYYNHMMDGFGMGFPGSFVPLVLALFVWSVFWKGLALWHSARRGEQWWFVAFLFINTMGILEIIYLFVYAKYKLENLFTKK
jgi:hypothetical protein